MSSTEKAKDLHNNEMHVAGCFGPKKSEDFGQFNH